ncbi:WYL domain-containing protein (plasmid) [Halomonas qaidamensis]|uniref:WYL domain-containing protein n=1 Tax=Halomonas qaidamensis TaxID=2866211 RepID=A0ABY6JYR2_9GAMM|nr:WYL domain-containing protein [Halomonas qaidamensis]UYV20912.1 WYL domain-containing protein [Halomonas qaidamensis]
MDLSLYEDPQTGRFKPKKLSITKSPIKIKDVTDLSNMREDLKGLLMKEAEPIFNQFFNDEYAHELEVEEVDSAFNRATKETLGDLYCFKGHYSDLEELLLMGDDDESMSLSLSEQQTHQALKLNLIRRWTPSAKGDWLSLLMRGHTVPELKALMIGNGLEPKGKKPDLASDLAAFALVNPEKMPPTHEFLPGDGLEAALKETVTNMVFVLSGEIESHPYYYQYNVWSELMREWPTYEWPWLPNIISSHGGAPASAAVRDRGVRKKVSSRDSFEPDDWKETSAPAARLEISVPKRTVEQPRVISTPQPPKPAPSNSESAWAANDFEEPIEVLFKYQGERDSVPKERHVQIDLVFAKGGRVFLKGMCLKSQGMKMFMVDRIKGGVVSPATGELIDPREFTRVDDLRQALAQLKTRPANKIVSPPAFEHAQENTAKAIPEEPSKPVTVKKPSFISRLLAKLGG